MVDANDGISSLECETCFKYKEAGDAGYLNLGDGRHLCSDCSSIAVKSREECDVIIQNVFEFFRSLNLQVNENIPIVFINKNQMRNLSKGSGVEEASGLFYPSVSNAVQLYSPYSLPLKIRYGLMYILRKSTTICTIQMREEYSRCGLKSLNFGNYVKFLLGDTILVLSGKPDVAMGHILAHETMHGWFRSHGKAWELWERSVEEGICHVMAYKWLQWFSSQGFNSLHKTSEQVQYTRTLKEWLARDIEWNDNEVYGQGFRNAMLAIETFKFKPTLDHVVKNGTLPVVAPLPPVVMRKRTKGKTSDELVRKKTTTTTFPPIVELLWKASSKYTLKATAALWKVITATSETPRFVAMEGGRLDQYHQGQGHNNFHAPMNASLTLLLIFMGIVVEHN